VDISDVNMSRAEHWVIKISQN